MNILIVSHDVGGAELVSSWVRKNPGNNYSFVLGETAISIFKKNLNGIENHIAAELSQLTEE